MHAHKTNTARFRHIFSVGMPSSDGELEGTAAKRVIDDDEFSKFKETAAGAHDAEEKHVLLDGDRKALKYGDYLWGVEKGELPGPKVKNAGFVTSAPL